MGFWYARTLVFDPRATGFERLERALLQEARRYGDIRKAPSIAEADAVLRFVRSGDWLAVDLDNWIDQRLVRPPTLADALSESFDGLVVCATVRTENAADIRLFRSGVRLDHVRTAPAYWSVKDRKALGKVNTWLRAFKGHGDPDALRALLPITYEDGERNGMDVDDALGLLGRGIGADPSLLEGWWDGPNADWTALPLCESKRPAWELAARGPARFVPVALRLMAVQAFASRPQPIGSTMRDAVWFATVGGTATGIEITVAAGSNARVRAVDATLAGKDTAAGTEFPWRVQTTIGGGGSADGTWRGTSAALVIPAGPRVDPPREWGAGSWSSEALPANEQLVQESKVRVDFTLEAVAAGPCRLVIQLRIRSTGQVVSADVDFTFHGPDAT